MRADSRLAAGRSGAAPSVTVGQSGGQASSEARALSPALSADDRRLWAESEVPVPPPAARGVPVPEPDSGGVSCPCSSPAVVWAVSWSPTVSRRDSVLGVRGRGTVSTCVEGAGSPVSTPAGGDGARSGAVCLRCPGSLGRGCSVRPGPGTSACRMSADGSAPSAVGPRRGRGLLTAFWRRAASGTGREGNGRGQRSCGSDSPPRHSSTPSSSCQRIREHSCCC